MLIMAAEGFWQRNGTVAGIVIGVVVTILVALAVAWWQRPRKTLDWRVLTDEKIMGVTKAPQDLKVTYKGLTLTDPRLVTIRVANTGKQEIREEDFAENVKFKTAAGEIRIGEPGDNKGVGTVMLIGNAAGDEWELQPTLFNRGDYVDFQFLLDGGDTGSLSVNCRIAGETRKMKQLPIDPGPPSRLLLYLMISFLAGSIMVLAIATFLISSSPI